MPRWSEVEFPASGELREVAGDRLIRKFYTEFDTEVPAEREALVEYLLHPLEALSGRAKGDELRGLQLPDVGPTWKVVTVIVNHHRGLNPRINMLSASLSTEEETVYQEIYKQNRR